MDHSEIIDLDRLSLDGDQTWLYRLESPEEERSDIESYLEPHKNVDVDVRARNQIFQYLDGLATNNGRQQRQNFDSRTYTRPKKKVPLSNVQNNFNETFDMPHSNISEENHTSDESFVLSKPIDIDLSAPANNFHTSFGNRYLESSNNQSDSFTNISPPSLVSSIAMEESGTFSRQGSVSTKRGTTSGNHHEDVYAHNSIGSSMTTSILDEKEMNTSFLSQAEGHEELFPPSMMNSSDFNIMNSSNTSQLRRELESDLINSGTFNMTDSMDETLSNGRHKFHLRRSFLNVEPDDQDAINDYLKRNSRCNTDDLQDLASDLLLASQKREGLSNSSHPSEDSFLLGEGMSDSFMKETGRESINMTFNKRTSTYSKHNRNDMDTSYTLPNQTSTPENNSQLGMLTYRKSKEPPRQPPKRNATFRKSSPPSHNWNLVDIDVENMKNEKYEDIDSNKQDYIVSDKVASPNRTYQSVNDFEEKRVLEGRTMAGSSSDSLEGSSSSERTPPQPTTVPLSMDDLEYLAYQQHQSLFQDESTPMPKSNKTSRRQAFQPNDVSPIKSSSRDTLSSSTCSNKSSSPVDPQKYGTYRVNSSSTGNLSRTIMGYGEGYKSPYKASTVKRESSAPEFVGQAGYGGSRSVGRSPQKVPANKGYANNGLTTPRSVGSSPSRTLYNSRLQNQNMSNNNLASARYKQNSGSTTELRPMRSGLPASKLRQYSSHKELNRIPAPPRWTVASGLRPSSRTGFHSSNPVLHPAPLTRQGSYTISINDPAPSIHKGNEQMKRPEVTQRTIPTKATNTNINYGQPLKAKHNIPTFSTGGGRDITFSNPRNDIETNVKVPSSQQIATNPLSRPSNLPGPTSAAQRLPRPSGLPRPASGIPRKPALRPPSTYSLAPRPNDQADCY